MSVKKITSFILVSCVVLAGLSIYRYRHDISRGLEKAALPEEVPYAGTPPSVPPSRSGVTLPVEINLAVPFTPQAPHANWELPYKEFCEEASVLMAMRYIQGKPIPSPEDADRGMLDLKKYEEDNFGYYQDTNLADTARLFTGYFQFRNIQIIENPSVQDIRSALAQGKPVLVPAAGRQLNNPYFQNPGPLYHMMVIKGYTPAGEFIVNDPGTRRGADFIYPAATVMEAMHDWRDDANITQGQKAVLIIG